MDALTRSLCRSGLKDLKLSKINFSDELVTEITRLMHVKELLLCETMSLEEVKKNISPKIVENLEKIRMIHVAGAVTKSSLYQDLNDRDKMKVLNTLLRTEGNNFLGLTSYHYLHILLRTDLSEIRFVVGHVVNALSTPWKEQNLASLYLLIFVREIYPELITLGFFKNTLGTSEIFCPTSVKPICQILMNISEKVDLKHPIFKIIAENLQASKLVQEFFNGMHIVKPFSVTQYRIVTFLLTEILEKIEFPKMIPDILPKDYIEQSVSMYQDVNIGRDTKIIIEKLHTTLIDISRKNYANSRIMVHILKNFLYLRGRFEDLNGTITHYVVVDIINVLPMHGIEEIGNILKDLIRGTSVAGFKEQLYASSLFAHLIAQSCWHTENEWTIEQLKFLQKLCFFKDQSNKTPERLSDLLETLFYKTMVLLVKTSTSTYTRRVFLQMLNKIDKDIDEGNWHILRWPLEPRDQQNWTKVLKIAREAENSLFDKYIVLHRLSLWVAFHLLGRRKLPSPYCSQLINCYQMIENNDFVWDDIVNLILILLSQDSYYMKFIISEVFAVVCKHMSSTILSSILYFLDPQNVSMIHFVNFYKSSEVHLAAASDSEEPDTPSLVFDFFGVYRRLEIKIMKYRLRIVNLIKVYLNCEPSLVQTLKILSVLLRLLWFCLEVKTQYSLLQEIKTCLRLIPTLQFSESTKVTEDILVDVLQLCLFHKRKISIHMREIMINCSIFILNCSQLLDRDDEETSESKVQSTLTQVIKNASLIFFGKRYIPYNFLEAVFQSGWDHVDTFVLVPEYFNFLFLNIVPAKRIKGVKLLTLFFSNRQYIELHRQEMQPIEQALNFFLQTWVGFFKMLNGKDTVFDLFFKTWTRESGRSRKILVLRLLELFHAIKTSPLRGIVLVWADLKLEMIQYCSLRATNGALQKRLKKFFIG